MVTGEGSVQDSGMVIRKRNVPGHHSLCTPVLATKTGTYCVPRHVGSEHGHLLRLLSGDYGWT